MQISEFVAWFNGFCEGIGDNPPNMQQWKLIRERVNSLNKATPGFLTRKVREDSGSVPFPSKEDYETVRKGQGPLPGWPNSGTPSRGILDDLQITCKSNT